MLHIPGRAGTEMSTFPLHVSIEVHLSFAFLVATSQIGEGQPMSEHSIQCARKAGAALEPLRSSLQPATCNLWLDGPEPPISATTSGGRILLARHPAVARERQVRWEPIGVHGVHGNPTLRNLFARTTWVDLGKRSSAPSRAGPVWRWIGLRFAAILGASKSGVSARLLLL